MDIPITFLDFKTEENYLKLQNKFSRLGKENNLPEDDYQKVVKDDFTIIYKSINPVTYLEDYKTLSFDNDFLFPKIYKLAKGFINWFKIDLEEKLFIDEEKIELYAKLQMKKFNELKENILNSKYLNKKIRVVLDAQITIIIEYLSNVHILPNYLVEDKLKVNLNKTDILVLFTLLREKKIIDSPFDPVLGLFIERNFLYKDADTYTSIKNAGKVVNDIKNSHKPIEKSIDRLKKIFKNDEFYELETH
ncbi:MAG: hypothetical protein ACYCZ2_11545 [Lutibacter sp.]